MTAAAAASSPASPRSTPLTTTTLTTLRTHLTTLLSPLKPAPYGAPTAPLFPFSPTWTNLNHGSFGATPTAITAYTEHLRAVCERRPDHFLNHIYPPLIAASLASLSPIVHAPASTLALVGNATLGVNVVLRAIRWVEGDVIVMFDFAYMGCANTVRYIAASTPATAHVIPLRLPASSEAILGAFKTAVRGLQAEGKRVRLAMFETIVSVPGIRLPFEGLVAACKELGVWSLVDGAHGVGMIPLDLGALDCDFAVSNLHKWFYVPRGCCVLYVPERNQEVVDSGIPTSWGYGMGTWSGLFQDNGTQDVSAFLSVGAALEWRERVSGEGGEEGLMRYMWDVAEEGAKVFEEFVAGAEVVDGGDAGRCALANVRLPVKVAEEDRAKVVSYIHERLMEEFETKVYVFEYYGEIWARVSGQIYLERADFVKGAEAMAVLVKRINDGSWLDN